MVLWVWVRSWVWGGKEISVCKSVYRCASYVTNVSCGATFPATIYARYVHAAQSYDHDSCTHPSFYRLSIQAVLSHLAYSQPGQRGWMDVLRFPLYLTTPGSCITSRRKVQVSRSGALVVSSPRGDVRTVYAGLDQMDGMGAWVVYGVYSGESVPPSEWQLNEGMPFERLATS